MPLIKVIIPAFNEQDAIANVISDTISEILCKSYADKSNFTSLISNAIQPQVKQLIKELEKAGFINRGGKGSHRNFVHPAGVNITVSGKLGDDAKHYQEKEVEIKIKRSKK